MAKRSQAAPHILLVLLGAMLGAVLSVGLVRLLGAPPGSPLSFLAPPSPGWTEVLSIHEKDESIGYVLLPASSYRHQTGQFDVVYTIGEDGSRQVPGFRADQPEVLVLGDSWTFGHGVGDSETYPALMQQALPGLGIRNLGVMGYGPPQVLLTLQRALQAHPDVEWVFYGWIDFHLHRAYLRESNLHTVAGKRAPWFEVENGELVSHGLVDVAQGIPDATPGLRQKEWAVTMALVESMNRLSARHGARFALIVLPGSEGSPEHKVHAATMRANLEDRGIPFIDLEASLDAEKDEGFFIPEDGHPNARWHQIIGSALAEELSRE